MVSIKDIADKAGVSRGTVDRVLHGRGRVAPETAQKILKLAEEMGYTPGAAGVALAAHKKKLRLGFVYVSGEHAPFYKPVEQAARRRAKELEQYGVEVFFFCLEMNEPGVPGETYEASIEKLRKRIAAERESIQGWAVPGVSTNWLDDLFGTTAADTDSSRVPFVFYNLDGETSGWRQRIAFVGCDYEHSGRIACGLTARMTGGSGKIMFVTYDDGTISSSVLRVRGFQAEMEAHYPEMETVGTMLAWIGQEKIDVAERADETLRSNPQINAVYIANPGNYSICEKLQRTAVEQGRHLCIITNDLIDERQEKMLQDGIISATICQEPDRQGGRPLQILYEAIAFGKIPDPAWEKTKLEIIIGQCL